MPVQPFPTTVRFDPPPVRFCGSRVRPDLEMAKRIPGSFESCGRLQSLRTPAPRTPAPPTALPRSPRCERLLRSRSNLAGLGRRRFAVHRVTVGLLAGFHGIGQAVLLAIERLFAAIHPISGGLFEFRPPLLQAIGAFPR